MTHRLGTRVWATGIAVLAAVAACGSNSASPGPSTAPPTSATVSQSAAPSSLAAANATALIRRYFQTLDAVRQSASTPISQLSTVATSVQLNAEEALVKRERSAGYRQTGTTRVVAIKVDSVNLDNSNPSAGAVPTVAVDVCWDVSHVDVVDASGHSIVSPSRVDRGWTQYLVSNYRYTTDPAAGWLVSSGHDLKRSPCVGP